MDHLIQRQILDVHLPNDGKVHEQQEAIRQLYWERIVPALDEAFSKIVPNDITLRIDELRINVGTVSTENLAAEIIQQVTEQLKDVFFKAKYEHQAENILSSTQTEEKKARLIVNKESYAKALLFFLKNGLFPWWFKSVHNTLPSTLLKKTMAETPQILIHFIATQQSTQIQKRLLIYFSEEQLLQLVKVKQAELSTQLSQVLSACLQLDVVGFFDKKAWKNAISFAIKKTAIWVLAKSESESISATEIGEIVLDQVSKRTQKPVEEIRSFVKKEIEEKQKQVFEGLKKTFDLERESKEQEDVSVTSIIQKAPNMLEKSTSSEEPIKPQIKSKKRVKKDNHKIIQAELSQGIYIANAGLVLLAPFLQRYFETVDLFENQQFISVEAQERALLLTQYLVTGETSISEHELFLNKIIVGWPLADPPAATIVLTAKEESETQDLLHAVIKHWGALGYSGIAALQETFLQREGKLISKEDQYKLIVERKTVDLLMDKIPWSFSIIKLPWMDKRIELEW